MGVSGVLRYLGPLSSSASLRAETNRIAGDGEDRPHEAVAEAIVHAAITLRGQAGGGNLALVEAVPAQLLQEAIPRIRGVPDRVVGNGIIIETALGQHAPPGLPRRGVQLGNVELHRNPVGINEAGTARTGGLIAPPATAFLLIVQFHPALAGQQLHSLDEGNVLDLLHEGDDVPALTATEAMPAPHAGAHVEGGSLFVMERAQPLVRINASGPQRHVSRDDLLDSGASSEFVNVLALDQPCHGSILVTASDSL